MYEAIYFFGESHVDAVRDACASLADPRLRVVNLAHISHPVYPSVFESDLLRQTLSPPPDTRCLYVSMVGGNAHNVFGLLEHTIPFDFILPDEPELELLPGRQLLTYGYITESLRRLMVHATGLMEAARGALTGPIVHVESPPPIGDDDYIAANLDKHLKSDNLARPVAPALLRYKLWRVHAAILRQTCEALGITFLPAPAGSLANGFLRPEFYSNATHANGRYGAMVVAQVKEIVP